MHRRSSTLAFTPPRTPLPRCTGYADTTSNILNKWFHTFFPQALKLGLELDARGGRERLHFMAQSWIVSLFLDCPPNILGLVCPTPQEVSDFERAVTAGYITWHALPWNGEPELMSRDMFDAALNLTFTLDDRFALPHKATVSQRDVPGMTRAVLPALAAAGVRAVTIGANPFSTPPSVPRAFLWRDVASGIALPTMLHPRAYGGISYDDAVIIPGLAHAIVFDWRGDNAGPPLSVDEVVADFKSIAATFPGAEIVASTLDDFTALLTPAVTAQLPVIEAELGDTWLFGSASDPLKSAMNKRAAAARSVCIAPGGGCAPGDAAVANFTRLLLKNSEHTWGLSVFYFMDPKNWTNAAFNAARAASPKYAAQSIASWHEQRAYGLDSALEALTLAGHPLAATIKAAWADLRPSGAPSLDGWTPAAPATPHVVGAWTLAFDAVTGAISQLVSGTQTWVDSAADGSFLGLAEYHTYDNTSIFAWEKAYNGAQPNREFGRDPSFSSANTELLVAQQRMLGLWSRGSSFLVHADFGLAKLHTDYGAPADMWIQYDVSGGAVNVSFTILNKTATRLLEGLFFRCNVTGASDVAWRVQKIGEDVDPFDVQPGGGARHHGVDAGVTARTTTGAALFVGAPDAPLAAFGAPMVFALDPSGAPVDPSEGLSFLLYDNLWQVRGGV